MTLRLLEDASQGWLISVAQAKMMAHQLQAVQVAAAAANIELEGL